MDGNKEYVEACIDIPVERKALCYTDCALNANHNQNLKVSYKSAANPFGPLWTVIEIRVLLINTLLVTLFNLYVFYVLSKDCSTPLYEIERRDDYRLPMTTKEYGIEFYVVSSSMFDQRYPVGTQNRTDIENRIIKEYIQLAWGHCDYEQRHNFLRPDIPTPVCDRLQTLGIPRTRLNAPTN
ncbi:hypothetical protein CTI12_AA583880 [Artemisia annua]|uniref:DUF1977 domain-containing protein n=1 Tax=Artemisia annua TaxID=35608 RepID=A0A2U1KMN6_ARTAN|nr:hypothetical protein CTI12_AA583880 [Artemisia annua]